MDLPPPPRIDPRAGDALTRGLLDAGFGPELFARIGDIAGGFLDPLRVPLVREVLARDGSTGARLSLALSYGGPRPSEPEALVAALDAAGMLDPRLRLVPFAGMFVVADTFFAGRDAVMPPGGTTAELARVLPPCAGRAVLDMGGGPGTLALYAAREGAARAVSTDLNARTDAFVVANAALNGVAGQVEARVGDLFAPVAAERFDIVVSQPPFIMKPPDADAVTYLHGGDRGDEVARRLIGEVDGALAPGGTAIVRLDAARDPHHLVDAIRSIDAPPRQTAVFWWPGPSVEDFAVVYGSVEDPALGDGYAAKAASYREHLVSFGIERLVSALVVTRRTGDEDDAPPFVVGFGMSTCPRGWDEIEVAFAAFDLSMRDDEAFLRAALAPHPELRIDERRVPGYDASELRADVPHGAIGPRTELEPDIAALTDVVATTPEVADLVSYFSGRLGIDEDASIKAVLPHLRRALQTGLLVVRGDAELAAEEPGT